MHYNKEVKNKHPAVNKQESSKDADGAAQKLLTDVSVFSDAVPYEWLQCGR
jgi:hypothetical protein